MFNCFSLVFTCRVIVTCWLDSRDSPLSQVYFQADRIAPKLRSDSCFYGAQSFSQCSTIFLQILVLDLGQFPLYFLVEVQVLFASEERFYDASTSLYLALPLRICLLSFVCWKLYVGGWQPTLGGDFRRLQQVLGISILLCILQYSQLESSSLSGLPCPSSSFLLILASPTCLAIVWLLLFFSEQYFPQGFLWSFLNFSLLQSASIQPVLYGYAACLDKLLSI